MNLPARINRKIRQLQAESKAQVAKVREEIAKDMGHYRRRDLDPKPILELLEKRARENGYLGIQSYCETRGISERQVLRAKAAGWITERSADEICSKLLVPFASVYPYELILDVA